MQFRDKKNYAIFNDIIKKRSNNQSCGNYCLDPCMLVMNISEGCNLTCPYCFAKAGKYSHEKPLWMTEDVAYRSTEIAIHDYPNIANIKLFGGEPFMNVRAIRGVVRAVEESGRKITVGCVTNMTIYSPVLVDLIRRVNMRITFSVDGPQEIHDISRRYTNGRGSFAVIERNVSKYREQGINPRAVECVYTPLHYQSGLSMEELVDCLAQHFCVEQVILTPMRGGFTSSQRLQEQEFANIVRNEIQELFRHCVTSDDPVKQGCIHDAMRILFAPNDSHLWCGLGQDMVTVAADGTVYPCYTLLSNREQWRMADSIDALNQTKVPHHIIEKLVGASPLLTRQCDSCVLRTVCRGCPGGSEATGGEYTGVSPVSCAYAIGAVEGLIEGWRDKLSAVA